MRILHLVHVRFWNASAQYAIDLATAQQRAGHEVTVLTARDELPAVHAQGRPFQLVERSLHPLHSLDILHDIRRLGKTADVVNTHHADMQNLALLALRGPTRPTLVRTRVDVRPAKGGLLTRLLYNHRLDGVILPGEDSRQRYIDSLGVHPERLQVVYGGVDHQQFTPRPDVRDRMRAQWKLPPEAVVFGYVGRLAPIKAPDILIEAAQAVRSHHPHAYFVIAGKAIPGHEEQYRALADRSRSDGIRFLGHVDNISAVMNALDVGVITSVGSEAHCRVGLEMMSAGLPVIGTEVGVIPEVVKHNETGYIVRSRSARELASAMTKLACDTPLRMRFREQALRHIQSHFTYERWVAATEQAYHRARRDRIRRWI